MPGRLAPEGAAYAEHRPAPEEAAPAASRASAEPTAQEAKKPARRPSVGRKPYSKLKPASSRICLRFGRMSAGLVELIRRAECSIQP